ncbi:MAG: hypothetical protein ACKO96_24265, partial [Flammeovirgaceae bacterium]
TIVDYKLGGATNRRLRPVTHDIPLSILANVAAIPCSNHQRPHIFMLHRLVLAFWTRRLLVGLRS